jgi:quinol monooxygenase YgiN
VIIVTGSVKARPETRDEIVRISLEHVHRSRRETGCLLHSVHRDVEDTERFVFIEHWTDRDALRAHFRVPESGAFATALGELAAEPPTMEIYDVTEVSPGSA